MHSGSSHDQRHSKECVKLVLYELSLKSTGSNEFLPIVEVVVAFFYKFHETSFISGCRYYGPSLSPPTFLGGKETKK